MFVNEHARQRLMARLPEKEADAIIRRLESTPGDPGRIGIVLARLGKPRGDDRQEVELRASNGDTVVAIAVAGEVTTVYYRRSWNQRIDAAALAVERMEVWA